MIAAAELGKLVNSAVEAAKGAESEDVAQQGRCDLQRDKIRQLLHDGLALVDTEQREGHDPGEVAAEVEAAIFNKFGSASSAEYKAKVRSLSYNFKDPKNPDLRQRVLLGDIDPQQLIEMSPEELASDEKRQQNYKIRQEAAAEAVRGQTTQASTDMFKCARCKQSKCTYYVKGVPSVMLATALPWLLPDSPDQLQGLTSSFLSQQELQLLKQELSCKADNLKSLTRRGATENEGDQDQLTAAVVLPLQAVETSKAALPESFSAALLIRVMKVWQIWHLALCMVLKDIALMALMMWLPVMVHSLLSGGDPTELAASLLSTGRNGTTTTTPKASAAGKQDSEGSPDTGTAAILLTAVPFTAAAVATALIGRHAQRTGESLLYVAVPGLLGGGSFILFHWLVKWSRMLGFACLVLTMACGYAVAPHALTVVTKLSSGMKATGLALPLFNSVTNLGGFLGPSIMGFMAERFGGFGAATTVLGGSMTIAGILAAALRCIMIRDPATRAIVSPAGTTGWGANGDISASYELVYRRSSGTDVRPTAGGEPVGDAAPAVVREHKPPTRKATWVVDRCMVPGSSLHDDEKDGALEGAALLSADSLVKRSASSSSSARRGPAVPGMPCISSDGVGKGMADHDTAETRRLLASSSSFGSKRRNNKAVPP
eukprot:gene5820-6061_t